MEKIWFFVEGDTEAIFISNLFRYKFHEGFKLEKDLVRFIHEDIRDTNFNRAYCENCGSVDKIPHRINEMYHFVEKSQASHIIVVCDVEKLKCHSRRKDLIESKFETSVDKSLVKYVFFKPMMEYAYWECPRIIKKIIELEYRKKFSPSKIPEISLPVDLPYSQDGLKKFFRKFKLKYRETIFAGHYFPRVDYANCHNIVLARLNQFLESI